LKFDRVVCRSAKSWLHSNVKQTRHGRAML
jgi:hypothetical protein